MPDFTAFFITLVNAQLVSHKLRLCVCLTYLRRASSLSRLLMPRSTLSHRAFFSCGHATLCEALSVLWSIRPSVRPSVRPSFRPLVQGHQVEKCKNERFMYF